MSDEEIVMLYWSRKEEAVEKTAQKYGNYCYAIAYHILYNAEDAEECVNDTYLNAWNSIPPHRPEMLAGFLGKLTRRLALKRWRYKDAKKRGGGETELVLEELAECVASNEDVETELLQKELTASMERFLEELPVTERRVFVRRYWYMDSIKEISERFGFRKSKVESMLYRLRLRLRSRLEQEGMIL
ncbi:MAG: RNA polymerase sigma factor [Lachnospiraceae bacterium]|nr:RNA polymerase sigma factor [Lachnospiraceae bacterium]